MLPKLHIHIKIVHFLLDIVWLKNNRKQIEASVKSVFGPLKKEKNNKSSPAPVGAYVTKKHFTKRLGSC